MSSFSFMRRITIFILALLYITTFSGVPVDMHYCMGKRINWDFSHSKVQNCANCGMKKSESKGCCEDKEKLLRIDTEQKIADAAAQLPLFASLPALVKPSFELTFAYVPSIIEKLPTGTDPLRTSGIAVYIRNCIFLI